MAAVKSSYLIAISALLCVCVLAAPLHAASGLAAGRDSVAPAEELQHRLQSADGIVASFTQQVSNERGFVVEEASGTLQVAKPRFRWEVQDPYPQIILADGKQLEVYDPDLEQVTTREMTDAIDEAPLALLTQEDLQLTAHFTVEAGSVDGTGDTPLRYILRPLSAEALFDRLELVFLDDKLLTLVIHDHTGQRTLIRFTEYRTGQVLQSEVFELEYPPGTDFVRG